MKKILLSFSSLLFFCVCMHYYTIDQFEAQKYRMGVINSSIDFYYDQCSNLRIEDSVKNKNKIDSLEIELNKDYEYLSDAYHQIQFYNFLKQIFPMDFILLLIGASSLIYWYSHRNDKPEHPKLFWTLILGWLYILYYVCNKKNL